jgi:hypothetical protein
MDQVFFGLAQLRFVLPVRQFGAAIGGHLARPAQHGTGTRRHEHDGHDATSCRAVPALWATLQAQHEHGAQFSCRAGPRHDDRHDGPFLPCRPVARRPAAEGRKRPPATEEHRVGGRPHRRSKEEEEELDVASLAPPRPPPVRRAMELPHRRA